MCRQCNGTGFVKMGPINHNSNVGNYENFCDACEYGRYLEQVDLLERRAEQEERKNAELEK